MEGISLKGELRYKEIEAIVKSVQTISGEQNREKAFQMLWAAKQENVPCEKKEKASIEEREPGSVLLKLTQKEILRIPMRYRRDFLIEGRVVHCQKRKSGKKTFNYMLRYRRNGCNICVSSNNLEEAKEKFIIAMQNPPQKKRKTRILSNGSYVISTNFDEFATYYFEKYRKRKVSEQTYENDSYRYKNHLLPRFGRMDLTKITPMECQEFLDKYEAQGKHKTTRELYSLLNGIFKMAIAHNIIQTNPLAVVIVVKHESVHGKALTKAEEGLLLESVKGSKYETIFALALYTGLRPNELYTVRKEGDFIVAKNSKRKGGKIEYKKIPISPMLRPYLEEVETFDFCGLQYVRDRFNQILPSHILYDLRTTFYTRCEECGVAEPARDHFVGHSRGVLNNTYTDLSDEYLLNEGKKLVW